MLSGGAGSNAPAHIFGSLFHEDLIALSDYVTLNGGNVSGWTGTEGKFDPAQGTAARQPLWVADGPGAISGEIDFDGSNDHLRDNTPTGMGVQGDYISALTVIQFDDLTGNGDVWGSEYAWAVYDAAHLDGGLRVTNAGEWSQIVDYDDGGPGALDVATESGNDTAWHAQDLVMSPAGHRAYVDNAEYSTSQMTQTAGLSAAWATKDLFLGCVDGGADGHADVNIARMTWLTGSTGPTIGQRNRWWAARRALYGL